MCFLSDECGEDITHYCS
ncbi:hypothetical protein ACF3DV_14265 [Chlorogloeopsis fritschii PCC 9212]